MLQKITDLWPKLFDRNEDDDAADQRGNEAQEV